MVPKVGVRNELNLVEVKHKIRSRIQSTLSMQFEGSESYGRIERYLSPFYTESVTDQWEN